MSAGGSGGGFQTIDTSGFDEVILRLDGLSSRFNNLRGQLISNASTLLAGNWEGNGADAFSTSFGNIRRYFDDDLESLINITDNLRKIKTAYLQLDAEMARKFEEAITGGSGGGGGGKMGGR